LYFDRILDLEHLSNEIESLNTQYSSINQRAEEYIVSERAYKKALDTQNKKTEKEPSLIQKVQAIKTGEGNNP